MSILYENPCYILTCDGEIEYQIDWYEGKFTPLEQLLYYEDVSKKYTELILTNLD